MCWVVGLYWCQSSSSPYVLLCPVNEFHLLSISIASLILLLSVFSLASLVSLGIGGNSSTASSNSSSSLIMSLLVTVIRLLGAVRSILCLLVLFSFSLELSIFVAEFCIAVVFSLIF